LSITKNLVRLHGGKLDVSSKVGEGSTFSVSLPVHDGISHEEEVAVTTESTLIEETELLPIAHQTEKTKSTILVVDDEKINLQVLMNQLSLEGYEVITVLQGEEVFHILDEHDIDLIILDIMMPEISGYE